MQDLVTISKEEYEELVKKARDGVTFLKENQLLHSENEIASQIQRGMLPGEKLIYDDSYLSIYADMDTAKEVGGDFYDYKLIDDNHLFFCIGDVCGKGVPAIIHMVACKLLLRTQLKHISNPEDLSTVFYEINEELYKMSEKSHFVTCFAGILELSTGRFSYINAGHTKTIIVGNGEPKRLDKVSGLPLGAYFNTKKPEKNKYKVYETMISEGDLVFTYTDGAIEAMNADGEMFSLERIEDILNRFSEKKNISELVTYLQRQIITFENHEDQDDDLTIMAVQMKNRK